MTNLNINQEIILEGIVYRVIGIDTYKLKNVLGNNKDWLSYTLIDKNKNKTWVSYGVAGKYFTQWFSLSESEFKNAVTMPPHLELSGIAEVSFQGNPGYSTPFTEIVWFNASNKNYDFLAIERFLQQSHSVITPLESYFLGGKVLKKFQL